MSTVIYFAKNGAFFVQRTVTKELTAEDMEDQIMGQAHAVGLGAYMSPAEMELAIEQANLGGPLPRPLPPVVRQATPEELAAFQAGTQEDVSAPPEARAAAREAMEAALQDGAPSVEAVTQAAIAQSAQADRSPFRCTYDDKCRVSEPHKHSFPGVKAIELSDEQVARLKGGLPLDVDPPGVGPSVQFQPYGPTAGAQQMPSMRRVRRKRRHPVTVTSTITDPEEMLDLVGSLISKQSPSAGPQVVPYPGGGYSSCGGLSACEEKITIERVDEGFCLTHHKPIDVSALSEATQIEGDEWKGKEHMPGWIRGVVKLMGSRVGQGPTDVYGFRKAEEVVAHVRKACEKRGSGWKPE